MPPGISAGRSVVVASQASAQRTESPRLKDERRDPPRRRRGWWKWVVAGLVVAAAVGVGLHRYDDVHRSGASSDTASRQKKEGESPAIRVKTVRPQRGGITRTTTQPGVVHYFEYADLYAKASGYLRAQVVDIGDTVTRGQVLAEVYDPERQQHVEEAAAHVEQAKSEVTQAEALIKVAEAEVQAAEAEVKEREAEVARYVAMRKYHQKQYLRYVELAESRAVDESARAGEEVSLAAVLTAKGRLAKAVAGLEKAKADLTVARARQRVAEAGEATARVLAEYIEIVSPYDGVVTRRSFHRGSFVRSATEGGKEVPVLSIARTDLMRVIVYIPDRDVPYVDRGDQVVMRFDALPGEVFRGTIARYSDLENSANRTMRVEIDLPNCSGRLREGMYGPVTVLLEPPSDVLTIPAQAVIEKTTGGAGKVFVVRGGKARKETVRVGKDNGMRTEILSGLQENDAVVLSYTGSLEDGDEVDARPATASEATANAKGGNEE
jgi:HlyD family secretion protein